MTISHHPFRFGVSMFSFQGPPPHLIQDWRTLARKAEDLGYATMLLPDHLPLLPAPVPALMAAADATTTLRVGSFVFNNMLRHPAVLASELATLDALSHGRVELGLGAGNPIPGEFEALGLTNDRPGVRVRKLEETIQIIKGFFSNEPFTYSGEYYSVKDLTGSPTTVQRPHPPLFLAAGQERMLTLAAHEADIVAVQPLFRADAQGRPDPRMFTAEAMDEQIARLRNLAGERFSSLELNSQIRSLTITNGSSQETSATAGNSLSSFTGSVKQICEQLYANRERFGFSYIVVTMDHMETLAPVVAQLAGK
jgi:probable F420-dependent oxidoreductase